MHSNMEETSSIKLNPDPGQNTAVPCSKSPSDGVRTSAMPCYFAHLIRDLSKLLHAVPCSKSTALMVFRTRRLLLGIVFHGPVQCCRYLMWALHQPFLSYRCVAEAAEGRYQLSGLPIQKVAIKDSHPLPTMRRLHQMHMVKHCIAIKSQIH